MEARVDVVAWSIAGIFFKMSRFPLPPMQRRGRAAIRRRWPDAVESADAGTHPFEIETGR